MKKAVSFFLLLSIFSSGLFAQEESAKKPSGFYYMVNDIPGGFHYTIMPNMRNFLKQVDVKSTDWFGAHYGSLGVGYRHGDWLFNLFLAPNFFNFSEAKFENTQSLGSLSAERTVLQRRNMRMNLGAGIGYYEYGVQVNSENEQNTVAFDQLLQSRFQVTPKLTNNGGAFDVYLQFMQVEKRSSGALLAWRLGYRYGWTPRPWKAEQVKLTDAPRDRLSQFYIQTSIFLFRNW